MRDLAQPPPAAIRRRIVRLRLGGDRPWLTVMAATSTAEFLWWAAAWSAGIAPPPFLATYLALAFGALCAALAARLAAGLPPRGASWPSVLLGTVQVGVAASLFLPLKYAIPNEIAFWLDGPLAHAERTLLGIQPWLLLDRLLGWAVVPVDRLYGLWLPLQSLVLFSVVLERPSRAKSRVLISYSLAWFVLGVAAAALLSSAGPLFYDRLFGGNAFAPLQQMLHERGAWVVLAESDRMWASLASGRPGVVAGISAVPSMHVAISVWIYLTARSMAPRMAPFAMFYALFMWIGSVQLGWHYVSDGLAGIAGMLAIWWLAGRLNPASSKPFPKPNLPR